VSVSCSSPNVPTGWASTSATAARDESVSTSYVTPPNTFGWVGRALEGLERVARG
jgi:hypothetical protein